MKTVSASSGLIIPDQNSYIYIYIYIYIFLVLFFQISLRLITYSELMVLARSLEVKVNGLRL